MSGHPHAALMAKAAEIAKTDKEWYSQFQILTDGEWYRYDSEFEFRHEREYRLEPRYININGRQVTEPIQKAPEYKSEYWVADFKGVYLELWTDDKYDRIRLQKGLMHLTKEAAEAHIAALLSFTQK